MRELRATEGKPRRATQRLARWVGTLGAIWGGLSAGSCLVTNEFEFATPDSPPTVVAVSPLSFTRVPNFTDPDCQDVAGDALRFDFVVTEPDPQAQVWGQLFVNGNRNQFVPIRLEPEVPGSTTRRPKPLCVPHAYFATKLCNRVQLVLSNSYEDVSFPPIDGAANPRINSVQWFVLAKSQSAADAVPSDCVQLLARDAGLVPLPDGAINLPPSDGGTLLPVDSGPPAGDGGP